MAKMKSGSTILSIIAAIFLTGCETDIGREADPAADVSDTATGVSVIRSPQEPSGPKTVLQETTPGRTSPQTLHPVQVSAVSKYELTERGSSLALNLPLRQKLRGRLGEVAGALKETLSPDDTAILRGFEAQEFAHLAKVRARLSQSLDEVCRARHGKSAEVLEAEFSGTIQALATESDDYYQSILNSLSAAGRQQVLRHIDATVSSGRLTRVRFDTMAFAREQPELARQAVEAACTAQSLSPQNTENRSNANGAFGTIVR